MPVTAGAQTIPFVPPWQTLFIGDSITGNWNDEPIHIGFYGVQACGIRLHFPAVLAQYPQVRRVVIEAGSVDIMESPGGGFLCFWPNEDAVSSVVDMVRTAKAAGLQVFVLSVLPISWNNRANQPCGPLVPPFNASLKAAVTPLGAIWVDDYDAFVGHPEYQSDGAHPNEEGYHVIEAVYAEAADPGACNENGVCPKQPPVP
jgi:lysophospholipase L1-like esterase